LAWSSSQHWRRQKAPTLQSVMLEEHTKNIAQSMDEKAEPLLQAVEFEV
jgi:hypothetical protein